MTVESWARTHEPSGDGAAPDAGAAGATAAGATAAGATAAGATAAGTTAAGATAAGATAAGATAAGATAAGDDGQDAAVAAVREFNRFYTNVIGLLRGKYLDTPYSLTESRLLFELGQREATEVTDLRRVVDIDPGYLSRILARFESDGLVARQRSAVDGRRQVIRLTGPGREGIA